MGQLCQFRGNGDIDGLLQWSFCLRKTVSHLNHPFSGRDQYRF